MVDTLSGPIGETRAASAAGGGTALSTTPAYIGLPRGTRHVYIEGRNYSTAVVAQFFLNPYLVILRTQNSLASYADYSNDAQDGDAATEVVLDAQDTAANGDYLYVGSHTPFGGVYCDISADSNEANGTASTLTVSYWDGAAWTDISATDNTKSGSTTFASDGTVTWTIPGGWRAMSLDAIGKVDGLVPGTAVPYRTERLYWTRWTLSAAIDALTRIDGMYAISHLSAYTELVSGRVWEQRVHQGVGGVGCVQAACNAGTANLIVNVATDAGGYFD